MKNLAGSLLLEQLDNLQQLVDPCILLSRQALHDSQKQTKIYCGGLVEVWT